MRNVENSIQQDLKNRTIDLEILCATRGIMHYYKNNLVPKYKAFNDAAVELNEVQIDILKLTKADQAHEREIKKKEKDAEKEMKQKRIATSSKSASTKNKITRTLGGTTQQAIAAPPIVLEVEAQDNVNERPTLTPIRRVTPAPSRRVTPAPSRQVTPVPILVASTAVNDDDGDMDFNIASLWPESPSSEEGPVYQSSETGHEAEPETGHEAEPEAEPEASKHQPSAGLDDLADYYDEPDFIEK